MFHYARTCRSKYMICLKEDTNCAPGNLIMLMVAPSNLSDMHHMFLVIAGLFVVKPIKLNNLLYIQEIQSL